jgi:hypothetical protein
VVTVADFLDRYFTNYVEAEGLKSTSTVSGHIKALRASLDELPVTALEKPPAIAKFKADYRKGHEVATVNRVLSAYFGQRSIGVASRSRRCCRRRRFIASVLRSNHVMKRSAIGESIATKSRCCSRPAKR